MKTKRIFCILLTLALLVTQIASLGIGSFAGAGAPITDDIEVTLINGAKVGTDDFYEAVRMVNVLGGGRIKLNSDIECHEYYSIYNETEIDLNGHSVSGGEFYISSYSAVTVTDSSPAAAGSITEAILTAYTADLIIENINLSGNIRIEEGASLTLRNIGGGDLDLYCGGGAIGVNISDAAFDTLSIEGSDDVAVRMSALTVNEEITVQGTELAQFFGSDCTTVKNGSGQVLDFEPGVNSYTGTISVTHDDTKIDTSIWKSDSMGHFHLCACGFKADFDVHTHPEKCDVCNGEPCVSVTVGGSTHTYFDPYYAFDYVRGLDQATVKLLDDVITHNPINISEASSVTLDLAGKEFKAPLIYVYEDASLTVTDTSEEKGGLLITEHYLDIADEAIFKLTEGGVNSRIDIMDNAYVELGGGYSVYASIQPHGQGTASITGGRYETLELYGDGTDIRVENAVITGRITVFGGPLESYFGHSCVTVDVGSGEPYDPYSWDYYCDGNSFTVTHSASSFSSAVSQSNGKHAKACSVCGLIKNVDRCTGGKATCQLRAVCEVCSQPYGQRLPHTNGDNGKCAVCNVDAVVKVEGDSKVLYFFNLEEAFDAAAELSLAKITVYDDVRCEDELDVYGNVTFDINGYEVYFDEINVYGSLVIDDSDGEGVLKTDSNIDIKENAELTVEGGIFAGEDSYIDLDEIGAWLCINGGTFNYLNIQSFAADTLAVISDITTDDIYVYMEGGAVAINGGTYGSAPYVYGYIDEIELLSAPCITLYNGEGDEISAEDYYNHDCGELRIEHNTDYQGSGYIPVKDGHILACACGAPKGDTAILHTGGTATCVSGKSCSDCGAIYGDVVPHSFVNGVCTSCGGDEAIRVDAQGFSQSFCNIGQAFEAAAKHSSATLTLLQNSVWLGELIFEQPAANITLDLSGYTLAIEYLLIECGSFTVRDSSGAKSGAILGSFIDFYGNSSAAVESGSVYIMLYTYDTVSVTVSGGTVYKGMYVYDNGKLTVNGGTFSGKELYICADDDSVLDISGGEFDIYEIDIDDRSALTVSGGAFKGDTLLLEYDSGASADISGGTFENGIILEFDEGDKHFTLSDVMANGCYVFVDANGAKVDMSAEQYLSYVGVSKTCSYALKSNKDGHWQECTDCADKKPLEAHADADGNDICDVCKFELENGGLGAGAIAGIVIAGVAVAGGGGFAVWFAVKKKSFAELIAVFKKK